MAVIDFPILYIPDPIKGRPLFNGQIFVGVSGLDPEIPANQKQLNVIKSDGDVVPVIQPFILSAGGVPVYNGSTVRLDVDGDYSLKILDRLGAQVYYIENVLEGKTLTIDGNYTSNFDIVSEASASTDISRVYEGAVLNISGRASKNDGGGGTFDVVLASSVTIDNVDFVQCTGIATLALAKRIVSRFGGISLIFDDGTLTVKNDLMPVAVANDFKSGLALFHSGMAASYDFVTLKEALDFKKQVDGEILSHSMNSVSLDASLDLTYGEALIRTSATEFSQFGFSPRGFVAPNSVLDPKFKPQTEQSFDFAFVRSVGAGAGLSANNNFGDDRYNLTRIALTSSGGTEIITLAEAKAYVDQARSYEAYVCFYAHTLPTYMAELMDYIKDTYVALNPTEWIGNYWGLSKDVTIKSTENLLINSGFSLINADDTTPFGWSYDAGTLVTSSITRADGEGGDIIAINSSAGPGGESGKLTQNYFFPALNDLTPFCFSIYARSLAISNTQIQLTIYAKDSVNTTIATAKKTFDIAANRQKIEIQEAFIADATVDHVLVEMEFIAISTTGITAILDKPQFERAGFPTAYGESKAERYYSVLRRVTGLTVNPNIDTLVNFDGSLEGTNGIFDLATGDAKPIDGRNYLLQCNFGLLAMVAGDIIECYILVDGVKNRKVLFSAVTGTNIVNPTWTIRSGSTYSVGIRHNNAGSKSLTTFSDATMTVTSAEN